MLENNTHVTGVAAYLFEKAALTDPKAAPGFVAGFSQSSVGDTTPNVLGAWCDDGSDLSWSSPAFQALDLGVSSCYIIGQRQLAGAQALYNTLDTVGTPVVDGSVKSFHFFQDMQFYDFPLANGSIVQTCPAALGYSFAAGTSDGPGAFDFTQNDPGAPSNPLWSVVSGLLRVPTAQQQPPCRVDAGNPPSQPQPAPPKSPHPPPRLSLAAPQTHTRTISLPRPEEYSIQRYEGASTLYGQHELEAYIHLTTSAIGYLAASNTSQPAAGPSPPNNVNASLSFITGVVYDSGSFGSVSVQPNSAYKIGSVVNATFVGANPRNNLRLEGTYTLLNS
ncbi:hypothetical protein DID88_004360 [Monilinia fructigena]|uniref:Neutral ceramidase n=1 Tax=Monilinia fructigena TaxID=38457 RepID=A0A395ITU6_9HELO|nr:hypothetical protein DID88_004360 [Monilinia fructigena]